MKLDDTGAAFFVEDVACSEVSWNVELATSPFPDQGVRAQLGWRERKLKPTRLFEDPDKKNMNRIEEGETTVPSIFKQLDYLFHRYCQGS